MEDEVKKTIRSLLTSTPAVSTVKSLCRDYKELIGEDIPFRALNYNCSEHFLKNIPDICHVNGSGPQAQVYPKVSEKTAHMNELVTKQKVPVSKNFRGMKPQKRGPQPRSQPSFQQTWRPRISDYNYSFTSNNSSSSSGNGWDKARNNYERNSVPRFTNRPNVNGNSYQNYNNEDTRTGHDKPATNDGNGQNWNKQQFQTEDSKPPSNRNYESTKSDNYPIYSSKHSPTGYHDNQTYKQETYTSEANTSHNNSAKKRPDSQPSIEKFIEKENSIQEEYTSNVPEKVQQNLKQLISQFDKGMWSTKLPAEYQKQFKKEIHFIEYGYSSLMEMCMQLKHIFHYVRPGQGDIMIYDRNKPPPTDFKGRCTMSSFSVNTLAKGNSSSRGLPEVSWNDFKKYIPEDVFPLGEVIENEFFPRDTKENSIFDVVVVEVYDPSKFWCYLGTKELVTPLDVLMDELQKFYKDPNNQKKYVVPLGCVQPELYCVQKIFGEYHRAKIVKTYTHDDDYVKLFYIDYATVEKAPTKGLYFLTKQFAKLKAQAIRCRLTNVLPIEEGPWPPETSNCFHNMVLRRDTKINIAYLDWENEIVYVFLADVSNEKKIIYVNEVLVNQGMAQWNDEERQVTPFNLSNYKCKVNNMHLFPTFFELENGQFPSNTEMTILEQKFVPVWFSLRDYYEVVEKDTNDIPDKQGQLDMIKTIHMNRKPPIWNKTPPSKIQEITANHQMDYDIFADMKDDILHYHQGGTLGDDPSEKSLIDDKVSVVKESLEISENIMKRLTLIDESEKRPLIEDIDFSDLSSDDGEMSIRIAPCAISMRLSNCTEEDSIFDCEPTESQHSPNSNSSGRDSGVHKTGDGSLADAENGTDSEFDSVFEKSTIILTESVSESPAKEESPFSVNSLSATNPFRHFMEMGPDEIPTYNPSSSDPSDTESYKSISSDVIGKYSKPSMEPNTKLPSAPLASPNPATFNPFNNSMGDRLAAWRSDPVEPLYQHHHPWHSPATPTVPQWNSITDPRYLLMNRSGNPITDNVAPPPGFTRPLPLLAQAGYPMYYNQPCPLPVSFVKPPQFPKTGDFYDRINQQLMLKNNPK